MGFIDDEKNLSRVERLERKRQRQERIRNRAKAKAERDVKFSERLIKVEESVKSAHHRLDDLENR